MESSQSVKLTRPHDSSQAKNIFSKIAFPSSNVGKAYI